MLFSPTDDMLINSVQVDRGCRVPEHGDFILVSDNGHNWSLCRFSAQLGRVESEIDFQITHEVMPIDNEYTLIYRFARYIKWDGLSKALVKLKDGEVGLTRVFGIPSEGVYRTEYGNIDEVNLVFVNDIKFGEKKNGND